MMMMMNLKMHLFSILAPRVEKTKDRTDPHSLFKRVDSHSVEWLSNLAAEIVKCYHGRIQD